MIRTATSRRLQLIEDNRLPPAGGSPVLRRFRLARVRPDARPGAASARPGERL